MGYENAVRINAANFYLFGSSVPLQPTDLSPFVLNTEWPGSVWDFSGVPIAREYGEDYRQSYTGALITPRHILHANHAKPTAGTDVYFRRPNGDLTSATIATDGVSSQIGADICISTLETPVTGCAIYPIPTSASLSSLVGSTLWCVNRYRRIVSRTVSAQGSVVTHAIDSSGTAIADGDSGQPAFTTRGGQLVLVGTVSTLLTTSSAGYNATAIAAFVDIVGETVETVSVDPASWVETLSAQLA